MKTTLSSLAVMAASAGAAMAHPSLQGHAHPHTDAASYFTVETLIIFALGLSIGGTIAWVRRRKEGDE
ncbi:hypothetical protein [Roseibium sp.]|uniref:hypothetical protein n=1 Tax=Roseibium sp. TaxID=1936156 RepID=UPI003A97C46D